MRKNFESGRWQSCYCCKGVVARYNEDGALVNVRHSTCNGTGRYWVYPSGLGALYPGGPYNGTTGIFNNETIRVKLGEDILPVDSSKNLETLSRSYK